MGVPLALKALGEFEDEALQAGRSLGRSPTGPGCAQFPAPLAGLVLARMGTLSPSGV